MVWTVRGSTWAGIMFKANTACEAKVVNLELNSREKQSKNEMKVNLSKCSMTVNAETILQVVWRPHLRGTVRSSKPANLAMSATET